MSEAVELTAAADGGKPHRIEELPVLVPFGGKQFRPLKTAGTQGAVNETRTGARMGARI